MLHEGSVALAPFDEMYHAIRIVDGVKNFPKVMMFDPLRGIDGGFVPWPPLYDWSVAGICRALGASSTDAILLTAAWIPPIAFALFVMMVTLFMARKSGLTAAFVTAIILAATPQLLPHSQLASIDHHFLESILVLLIALSVRNMLSRQRGAVWRHALLFAALLTVALFVQPALLITGGIAFVILFLESLVPNEIDARLREPGPPAASVFHRTMAAAFAFALVSLAVLIFRWLMGPAYPEEPWLLGYTHLAMTAAAALALLVSGVLRRDAEAASSAAAGSQAILALRHAAMALTAGCTLILAFPAAAQTIAGGARFFAGDPWLQGIEEFQPWMRIAPTWWIAAAMLAPLLLLLYFTSDAWRRRSAPDLSISLWTWIYFALMLSSTRFGLLFFPLLAICGGFAVGSAAQKNQRLATMLALTTIVPALLIMPFTLNRITASPLPVEMEPYLRAAQFLRSTPPGGVLSRWDSGHLIHAVSGHRVLLDNFGTWGTSLTFREAYTPLVRSVTDAETFFRESKTRYVVLNAPDAYLLRAVELARLPREAFEEGGSLSRYARESFWARAWSHPTPTLGRFRRVWIDRDPTSPFKAPSLQIWEYR